LVCPVDHECEHRKGANEMTVYWITTRVEITSGPEEDRGVDDHLAIIERALESSEVIGAPEFKWEIDYEGVVHD
jgi:hypothetical protein